MSYHALGLSSGLYALIFAGVWAVARRLEVSAHWVGLLFLASEILLVVFAIYALQQVLTRPLRRHREETTSAESAAP